MSRSTLAFLQHILDETQYLLGRARGLAKDECMGDEMFEARFYTQFGNHRGSGEVGP
jgi:hypothetical protein